MLGVCGKNVEEMALYLDENQMATCKMEYVLF